MKFWTPTTKASHIAFSPTKLLQPNLTTGNTLSSTLIETVKKVVERERELKEREREGAKRQTRCDFCLDLNRAERKGVGIRS